MQMLKGSLMRSKTVSRIMKNTSSKDWKEFDDFVDSIVKRSNEYKESISDENMFITIVESKDFHPSLMGSILRLHYSFPKVLYGYKIELADPGLHPGNYLFTKQN